MLAVRMRFRSALKATGLGRPWFGAGAPTATPPAFWASGAGTASGALMFVKLSPVPPPGAPREAVPLAEPGPAAGCAAGGRPAGGAGGEEERQREEQSELCAHRLHLLLRVVWQVDARRAG